MEDNKQPPLITKSQLVRTGIVSIALLLVGLYVLQRKGLLRIDDLIVLSICLPLLIIITWLGLKLGFAAFRQKEAWAIRLYLNIVKVFVAISVIGLIIKILSK